MSKIKYKKFLKVSDSFWYLDTEKGFIEIEAKSLKSENFSNLDLFLQKKEDEEGNVKWAVVEAITGCKIHEGFCSKASEAIRKANLEIGIRGVKEFENRIKEVVNERGISPRYKVLKIK